MLVRLRAYDLQILERASIDRIAVRVVAMPVGVHQIANGQLRNAAYERDVSGGARGIEVRIDDEHAFASDNHAGVAVRPVHGTTWPRMNGIIVDDGKDPVPEAGHARRRTAANAGRRR